jgi:hypothetical protein
MWSNESLLWSKETPATSSSDRDSADVHYIHYIHYIHIYIIPMYIMSSEPHW